MHLFFFSPNATNVVYLNRQCDVVLLHLLMSTLHYRNNKKNNNNKKQTSIYLYGFLDFNSLQFKRDLIFH